MYNFQIGVDKVMGDSDTARVSSKKDVRTRESAAHVALCKDYASNMLKYQVQSLRFVPLPRMPPIQIIPPEFPKYSFASDKDKAAQRQEKNNRAAPNNAQVFQAGTASKTAPHNPVRGPADRSNQAQRRPNPTSLRQASDAATANAVDADDQDFSRSLSSRSSASASLNSQSGIVLVFREFMGCHTMDIINMATQQGVPSDCEEANDNDVYSDSKTLLLKELKDLQAFFDKFASADAQARTALLLESGNYMVGSCKVIYRASQSIVPDDAPLVREEVNSLVLQLCDVLYFFSRDAKLCIALNFLLKALVKLHAATPQVLDSVLISCMCLAQDTPVLLEECSSPKDLMFSRAYIQVHPPPLRARHICFLTLPLLLDFRSAVHHHRFCFHEPAARSMGQLVQTIRRSF
jgi:hypothetical protein